MYGICCSGREVGGPFNAAGFCVPVIHYVVDVAYAIQVSAYWSLEIDIAMLESDCLIPFAIYFSTRPSSPRFERLCTAATYHTIHLSPDYLMPPKSPPALLCQVTFTARNEISPIPSKLLQYGPGSMDLLRFETESYAFAYSRLGFRKPFWGGGVGGWFGGVGRRGGVEAW